MTTLLGVRVRRRGGGLVIAAVLACLAVPALRVAYVHDRTWEYRLFPTSTPPKIGYDQRSYRRGPRLPKVEAGFVRSGETMGGGVIYAPSGDGTATVLEVRDRSRVVEYVLMGGP